MGERLIKLRQPRLKDETAQQMRQWEGSKKAERGKDLIGRAISGRHLLWVCVCVCRPSLDLGLLLLKVSEGLLSHSHSTGQQVRAVKWMQFQNIHFRFSVFHRLHGFTHTHFTGICECRQLSRKVFHKDCILPLNPWVHPVKSVMLLRCCE